MKSRFCRAIGLLLRLAWTLIVGWAVRYLRRLLRRPPRIWIGFLTLHWLADLAAAARYAGYPARSVVIASKGSYALVWDELFDRVLDSEGIPRSESRWHALLDLVRNADVWVTNFDCLFFVWHDRKNDLAFRLIRLLGIRIIVGTHGSDIVQLGPQVDRYGWVARMQKDYPDWDFAEQTSISRRRVELFCRYADLVLPADHHLVPWTVRCDALFKYFPVDTEAITPAPSRVAKTPLIVHAPNHRNVKGSNELIASAGRLHALGFKFELRIVEGTGRKAALQIYAEADILADQFIIGTFGVFALEGLALGKPVLTYLDPDCLQDPVMNYPIVNTSLENMDAVLAALITVPQLRQRIARAARAAVVQYQSVPALAEVWDQIYRHVWWGVSLKLDQTRHFDPARRARPLTEDPADPKFWPVEVEDLLPQIRDAVARGNRTVVKDGLKS